MCGGENINLRGEGSKRYIQGIINAIIQLMQDICEIQVSRGKKGKDLKYQAK